MTGFKVRQGPRHSLVPDDFGTDVPAAVVDLIKVNLESSLRDAGFSSREYSSDTRENNVNPFIARIAGRMGGEAGIEALEKGIDARAYFHGKSLPRREAILIDDGGTILNGAKFGSTDKVLKIAVRDAHGANAELAHQVETELMLHDIDVEEAKRVDRLPATGTVLYSLKRYTE